MKWIGSALLGGILAGINLYLLGKIVQKITVPAGRKGRLAGLVAAKFLVFFGIIALILWKGHVSPLAFLAGFSVPLVGYLCITLRGSG